MEEFGPLWFRILGGGRCQKIPVRATRGRVGQHRSSTKLTLAFEEISCYEYSMWDDSAQRIDATIGRQISLLGMRFIGLAAINID
jgi:hypothetical protein